ncbi:alpha/beta fold hydrolase [Bacillus timonensis]|nr:alpha/beta fold hydrolase [Bacillus timonensis]
MKGCLCIHGFTGGPYEVEPLANFLREATDWHVVTPTLPGHGEQLSLEGKTHKDWIRHAEEELQTLLKSCDEVYVVGFSMGGLIAAYLSIKYPVKKLVLLSAAAYYINPKQLMVDITDMVKDTFQGNLLKNELFLRYKRKINETPMSATLHFRALVRMIRPLLGEVKIPTLIVQGECDGIVPVKSATYLYQTINSTKKELCMLPQSKHHVCHGEDKEYLLEQVHLFLQKKDL